MDKGLDIAAARELLACHAAVNGDLRAALARARDHAGPTAAAPEVLAALRAVPARARPDVTAAERALDWARAPDHHILFLGGPGYPQSLLDLAQPPVVLFVAGAPQTLVAAQVAIVGSRAASDPGREFAARLAAEVAAAGVAVTSGLARGIDGAAHRGALSTGVTVAVCGCGIDRIYPPAHRGLADDIRRRGALVSEFPLGAGPHAHHFPRRNRLIAALSRATVVVEAALRSGSLSTALHALELGREIFAVPGSVMNPQARGCHALLRQGAHLLEDARDLWTELPGLVPDHLAGGNAIAPALPAPAQRLLRSIGFEPCSVDDLVRRTALTVQELSSMLLTLELAGLVRAHAAGTYVRLR